jgi:hypothetical protein
MRGGIARDMSDLRVKRRIGTEFMLLPLLSSPFEVLLLHPSAGNKF